MNFKEPGLEPKFRTDTVIADMENGKVVNNTLRQIYLQFPYFEKELSECETLYDKLIYTLKNMQHWNRMPEALKEQVFNRLEELASVANLSLEDRIAYDKALYRYRVSRIIEEDAREEGWKRGLEEGKKEGLKQGIEQGIKEGEKKGKLEKKRIIALNMKSLGIPSDKIQKATGLSEKDINEL